MAPQKLQNTTTHNDDDTLQDQQSRDEHSNNESVDNVLELLKNNKRMRVSINYVLVLETVLVNLYIKTLRQLHINTETSRSRPMWIAAPLFAKAIVRYQFVEGVNIKRWQ